MEDINDPMMARTPFEAFGHNETCAKWKDKGDRISMDHDEPCTCGGVELDHDGEPVDPLASDARTGDT